MQSYLILLSGVAFAALGGELFVRGAVGLAHWGRVAPSIVAVTVAALATSSPELSVAVNSALAGRPQLSLGDALGSNVVNVALILGTVLAISGMRSPHDIVRRDFPVALLVPLLTALLALDGELSRGDGAAMLGGFGLWLAAAVREALRQRLAQEAPGTSVRPWASLLCSGVGLAFLVAAGTLIVTGATALARTHGLDEFVIGATVVAVGTSVPELATAFMAKLRGHDEVGLGTVLGSNLFNGLFVVGVAASIHPIAIERAGVYSALAFGATAVALTWPGGDGWVGRGRGALLLALYGVYTLSVLL